jgi:sulfite reductase beta subunit-like hemoprotein
LLSSFSACPGLFYATPAQDGILSRIRIPGGMINSKQCRAIANIADEFGGGYVDITNRANLQLREIRSLMNAEVLKRLQDLGLGSRNTIVDHIRNIMTSPTAGIDRQELIDTRPFVRSWDNYIVAHPELSGLSAKFSVCFDGGGRVSVGDRLNDIAFVAVLVDGSVFFRLYLSVGAKGEPPTDMGILLAPEECLPVLAALADVYLKHNDPSRKRKLRLQELLHNIGCENYLQEVQQHLPFPLFSRHQYRDVAEKISRTNYSVTHSDSVQNYIASCSSTALPCPKECTAYSATHSDSVQNYIASCRGTALPCPKECTAYSATDSDSVQNYIASRGTAMPCPKECTAYSATHSDSVQNYIASCSSTALPCPKECTALDRETPYQHIGIHPQRQPGLYYIGVVLPLGRLETYQIRGLADVAEKYSRGNLRLTPWQNLLLTDIPQEWLTDVQNQIAVLGLDCSTTNIHSALVACSGNRGCAASATDTKTHALALAEYIQTHITLECPVNIHFSGCGKSCAQHSKSDIALLGVSIEDNKTQEGYNVYVGDGDKDQQFGRLLYQSVIFAEVPALRERMLKVSKNKRMAAESFREFANRYAIADLKRLFTQSQKIEKLLTLDS